ncbi:MAG: MarR family transcriptional regulator [Caulobacterales bacterium]|nr:MarR family transcriptional regulator [Caulobacterales bacterium]
MENHANKFNALYRSIFEKSSRRIRDKREMLSNESIAILNHMANIGPSTLSELCVHLDRAPSTLSEIIKHLEHKGFIERQNDETDKRRQFLWLSNYGFEALNQENNVIDENIVANAFGKMKTEDAETLLLLLERFSENLNKEG